jgi:hypothetical protein
VANRPADERIAEAVNAAARALGRTQNASDLESVGRAAFEYAALYCQGSATEADGTDPLLPPDTAAVSAGLTSLIVLMSQDPKSPGGNIGSDAYTGGLIPVDLLVHIGQYFDPYRNYALVGGSG